MARGDSLQAKAAQVVDVWAGARLEDAALEQALAELAFALRTYRQGNLDRVRKHRKVPRG